MASARGLASRLPLPTDADGVGFHLAFSDYEHGVNFHLFGDRI